jgi:hypothetical protein
MPDIMPNRPERFCSFDASVTCHRAFCDRGRAVAIKWVLPDDWTMRGNFAPGLSSRPQILKSKICSLNSRNT